MTVFSITTTENEGFAQLISQGEVSLLLKSSSLAESCKSCSYLQTSLRRDMYTDVPLCPLLFTLNVYKTFHLLLPLGGTMTLRYYWHVNVFRFSSLLGLISLIFLLTILYRFSVGFRSGRLAGQSSRVTPWSTIN